MAIVTPTTNKEELRERILTAVQDMYTEVAACPARGFHFPTGRPACEYIGYPKNDLDAILHTAIESFAGVGYPFKGDIIRSGHVVLDIGSGSGTDVLLAALKVGPSGKVYGIDMTSAMIEKARMNISQAQARNVEVVEANAELIPFPGEMFDVVTSNGVINLVPDKLTAYREIYRVLRSTGEIQISDIVLAKALSEKSRSNPQLWAECIVGALPEDAYLEIIGSAGFVDVKVIDRIDYFAKSDSESTKNAAQQYGASAITIVGRKSKE